MNNKKLFNPLTKTYDLEETMNTPTTTTIIDNTALVRSARNAMENVIHTLSYDYMGAIEKKYALRDDDLPTSAEDLIHKIKEGKYTAPDKDSDDYDAEDFKWQPYFGIRFRDPAMKKDREGYDKAWKAFTTERGEVLLKISVLEPADALKHVESLRSKYRVN